MEITAILTENITPNVPPDVSYEISPQDQALFITTNHQYKTRTLKKVHDMN
ncbi:10320_t:CDS:2, partial [Rhizophagus irregularis]